MVRCFGVFVEVVVAGPEGMVEVEVAEEYGSFVKRLIGEGGNRVDRRVVGVVVHVDDQKRVCSRFDF